MSQLINGVIQECKDNEIEVRPEAEIKAMLERWEKKCKRNIRGKNEAIFNNE